ncbi:MAG: hypothetical protein KDI06_10645 [Calditrichaeota bacterium]|nr:hypothetical protein [Calditrichota bacterium]HQU73515.1 hypothetical protein [Calditrichia bacterium]
MADFLEDSRPEKKEDAQEGQDRFAEDIPEDPTPGDAGKPPDFTGKLNEVAQKSFSVLKTSVDQVTHFAAGAKKMGELKLELHHLKSDRDKLLRTIGLRTWRLYQDGALATLAEKFAPEFERLEALEKRIVETEQRVQAVSLKK